MLTVKRALQSANKSVERNRRPASPFGASREVGSSVCAPWPRSAAVAHLTRSPGVLLASLASDAERCMVCPWTR